MAPLSVDELGQRLDGVYAARTVVELDGLLTDLPDSRALSRPPVRRPGEHVVHRGRRPTKAATAVATPSIGLLPDETSWR